MRSSSLRLAYTGARSASISRMAVSLQQLRKFRYAEAGILDYGTQRAGIQFPMVRDDHLSVGGIAAQNDVTAALPPGIEANSGEGADAFSPEIRGSRLVILPGPESQSAPQGRAGRLLPGRQHRP